MADDFDTGGYTVPELQLSQRNIENINRMVNIDEIIDSIRNGKISNDQFLSWYSSKLGVTGFAYTQKIKLENSLNELRKGSPKAYTGIKVMLQRFI